MFSKRVHARIKAAGLSNTAKFNKAFLDLGHMCEMPAEEDELESEIPGTNCCARLKRGFIRSMLVHEKICKMSSINLRSHGAIEREKQRHLNHHRSSIHPYSRIRMWWDFIMIINCFLLMVLLPLDVGFYYFTDKLSVFSSFTFKSIRSILDLICCGDVFVIAITGYYDEKQKEIVLEHGRILMFGISRHYLKNGLLVDILASLPTHFDLFISMDRESNTLKALQALSLIKGLRFLTFARRIINISTIFNISVYKRYAYMIGLSTILYWHFLSQILLFGYVVMKDQPVLYSYQNKTAFAAFTRSIYDGALIIYTASYGVEEPRSNYEYLMTNALWFISKLVQVSLLARVIEFLKARTSPNMKYSHMVKQLTEFMRHKQLPIHTQKRILDYYEFHYQKSYFRESEIFATISGQLRQEIVMQTCRQLVENVDFFKDLPLNLLMRIVSCLKSEIYLTNDIIIKANTEGNSMYFISTGTVAVYTLTGKEVCHLEDGAHFGEIALVTKDAMRVASVTAVEICELYRLDRRDFVKAIHPYPDLLEKIQRIAADRMEKTSMIDDHYKLAKNKIFYSSSSY